MTTTAALTSDVRYALRQFVEQHVNLLGELLRKHATHRVKLRALTPAAEAAVTVAGRILRLPAVVRVSASIREASDEAILDAAAAIKATYEREGESMIATLTRHPVHPNAPRAAQRFAHEVRQGVEHSLLARAMNQAIDERIARGGLALS